MHTFNVYAYVHSRTHWHADAVEPLRAPTLSIYVYCEDSSPLPRVLVVDVEPLIKL